MKRLDSHECAEAISKAFEHPGCVTLLHEARDAICDASHDFWDEVDGNYHYEDPNPERYKRFEVQIVKTAEEAIGTLYSHLITIDVDHGFVRNEWESQFGFSDDSENALEKVCTALIIEGNSDMRAALAISAGEGHGNSVSDARGNLVTLITPRILRLLANAPEPKARLCASTSPMAPYALFEMLANDVDKDNRAFYAASERATAELLDELSRDYHEDVKASVAQNPRTPTKSLRALGEYVCKKIAEWGVDSGSLRRAGYKYPYNIIYEANRVGTRLANNPHTPSDTLHKLSKLKSDSIKQGVACNPNALPETLRELLDYATRYEYSDRKVFIRFCAQFAENPSTPPEILQELAKDHSLLSDIANSWYLSQDVVEKIIRIASEYPDAGFNPPQTVFSDNTPTEPHLEREPSGQDDVIRRMNRECTTTPKHARQRFSYDPELVDWSRVDRTGILDWSEVSMWDENDWVLQSSEGGSGVAWLLGQQYLYSSDDDAERREALNARVEEMFERCLPEIDTPTPLLEMLSLSLNPIDRMEAALDENTSVETLDRLSLDHYPFVRSAVSSNKYADERTLRRLAKDTDTSVRIRLVDNENLPPDVLAELSEDEDQGVRFAVECRAERLKYLSSTRLKSDYTVNADTIEVMEELARAGTEHYLELLAKSKNTPRQTLEWIYSLQNTRLIRMLAHNPGMPSVPHPYVAPKPVPAYEPHPRLSGIPEQVAKLDELDELDELDDAGEPSDHYASDYSPSYDDIDDWPLSDWHFDEDNGWLDYYPEN